MVGGAGSADSCSVLLRRARGRAVRRTLGNDDGGRSSVSPGGASTLCSGPPPTPKGIGPTSGTPFARLIALPSRKIRPGTATALSNAMTCGACSAGPVEPLLATLDPNALFRAASSWRGSPNTLVTVFPPPDQPKVADQPRSV